jgi:hypothetical protein
MSELALVIERLAANPDVDVVKLEKIIDLRERLLLREAEAAFNAAMADCQQEMRPVATDADNPQTRSRYASYAQLDRALRPIYTKHGFAISYDTTESPIADCLRVLAYVTHRGGFTRTYRVDMPNDGKGAKGGDVMTKTHASGAAMSYGMRYLLKMIYNVAVGEDDTDGNTVQPKGAGQEPSGFDVWQGDLEVVAEEGIGKLTQVFNASKDEFKRHLLKHYAREWAALKNKAQKAGRS